MLWKSKNNDGGVDVYGVQEVRFNYYVLIYISGGVLPPLSCRDSPTVRSITTEYSVVALYY